MHTAVLLHEAVDALAVKPDGIYVDGTFGRGGHSRLILEQLGKNGRLIAFDQDPSAFEVGQALEDERFHMIHGSFSTDTGGLAAIGCGSGGWDIAGFGDIFAAT